MLVPDAYLQLTAGLENAALQWVLIAVAAAVFFWGFDRYRKTFSKTEFLIAILLSLGIVTVGLLPDLYGSIGAFLNIESRSLVVSLIANTAFVFLILYLATLIRKNQVSINDLTRNLAAEQAADVTITPDAETLFIVIPAYNESASVQGVIDELPDEVRGLETYPVVVSDGSTDGTADVVSDSSAIVVEHPINQGQGSALRTGFQIASKHGADVVVTMDADGQHPADQLGRLVGPIVDNEADYVLGSRYIGADNSNNGLTRQSGIRAFTALINLTTRADITDCTNGFRAIRGADLDKLTLTEERFSAPELIIEARKKGLRITEIPVTIKQRESGETKKPKFGYAVGLARTIFVTWIR
ncbi:DUF2304 family protein [Halostella litorea]|uniref:DUF2304 family protein n=1 Tax=Halostella litorea TaxID=2528831 RepID=UPI001091D198|nr:DUF2304 family protein [Halostella litorea]